MIGTLDFYKEDLKNNTIKILSLYPISLMELESMIDVNHKTLDAYRIKYRRPSALAMIAIALTFGITTDWLFGISPIPYTEESIYNAEGHCYRKFQETIPYTVVDNYTMPNDLEAKANLIVLVQYKHILSETSFKKSKLKCVDEWINEIKNTNIPKFSLKTYVNKIC